MGSEKTKKLGEPSTVAGRQTVTDVENAIASIAKETSDETVRMWMREVGPSLIQLVRVGVILAEKEKATEVQRQITGG